VTAALKEQGFGVLTSIDVQATLKQKLDVDTDRYVILGACNPSLAHQALQIELNVGLLLPCNVIVYENRGTGGSTINIVNPLSMMEFAGNPALMSVAQEAAERLQKVVSSL
jgi:uncharacterized protein (DUF302 family)